MERELECFVEFGKTLRRRKRSARAARRADAA